MSTRDGAMAQSREVLCDGICVDLRYLRFLRAMLRWLENVMVFAVKLRLSFVFRGLVGHRDLRHADWRIVFP